jgi:hypothetical protein
LLAVALLLACTALVGATGQTASAADAISWSTPADLSNTGTASEFPAMSVDSHGTVHLIWVEVVASGNERIYYSNNSGGGWSSPRNITDWDSHKLMGGIATDTQGNIYVTFIEYSNNIPVVKFMKGTAAGSWSSPVQLSA